MAAPADDDGGELALGDVVPAQGVDDLADLDELVGTDVGADFDVPVHTMHTGKSRE